MQLLSVYYLFCLFDCLYEATFFASFQQNLCTESRESCWRTSRNFNLIKYFNRKFRVSIEKNRFLLLFLSFFRQSFCLNVNKTYNRKLFQNLMWNCVLFVVYFEMSLWLWCLIYKLCDFALWSPHLSIKYTSMTMIVLLR